MIFPVSRQAYVFLCTVAGGMAIALVYDIFRIIRKAVRTGSLLTYAEDIVYWVISAAIMLFTIYYSNEGEIRGFMFIGTIIGVVLYSSLFSKIVMGSSLFIINMTIKIVKAVMFVILYPFRLILKMLAAPARRLAVFIAGSLRKAGYLSPSGNDGKKRFKKVRLVRKFVRRILKRRKVRRNKKVKS